MVYISYILVWSNIPHSIPTESAARQYSFPNSVLVPYCFRLFSISGLDIQELAAHACSRFAHGCSRFAHGCSRFAHGLLTVSEVPFESFTFFLSPYEVPFGSLRGSAHGCSRFAHGCSRLLTVCSRLLTVCSRFGKGAQNLCAKFQADVFWEIFEPCHGANPGSATIPHMKDSFWAQRTQKVHLESSI